MTWIYRATQWCLSCQARSGRGGLAGRRCGAGYGPARLDVEERLEALEWNGFTIADFTPDKVALRSFRWKLGREVAKIDGPEPFYTAKLPRPG